jgi:hypothetical protein
MTQTKLADFFMPISGETSSRDIECQPDDDNASSIEAISLTTDITTSATTLGAKDERHLKITEIEIKQACCDL